MKCLFVAAIISLFATGDLLAAGGDTHIRVFYRTKWIRDRPVHAEGFGSCSWNIILHPDGKIDDTWREDSGRSGSSQRTLGNQNSVAVFHVVNSNIIARVLDAGSHIETLTVRVAGKSCSADYKFVLKPGKTEIVHPTGFYRSIKMIETSCAID